VRTLPAALIAEKNLLASKSSWILLLDVTIPDGLSTVIHLARNTEDVVFNGTTYLKFAFEIDAVTKESSQGEIPSASIRVSNVSQALQAYVEEYDGLVDETVTLIVVNADHLAESYTELTLNFTITGCTVDAKWINFKIGLPNPLVKRYPLYRYLSGACNWRANFKGAECRYAGSDTNCTGTLEACRAKGNAGHFGGYPGLARGGIRIV